MTVLGVTWSLLWQTIWVSFAAGIGVAVLFSLVVVAGARASDARRAGRDVAAPASGCSPRSRSWSSRPGSSSACR